MAVYWFKGTPYLQFRTSFGRKFTVEDEYGRSCDWLVDKLCDPLFGADVGSTTDVATFELVRVPAVYDPIVNITEFSFQ